MGGGIRNLVLAETGWVILCSVTLCAVIYVPLPVGVFSLMQGDGFPEMADRQSWNRWTERLDFHNTFLCILALFFIGSLDNVQAVVYKIGLGQAVLSAHHNLVPNAGREFELQSGVVLGEIDRRGGREQHGEGYYISVEVGSPPQMINVLVDTGSSNFAIAASPDPYVEKYFLVEKSRTLRMKGISVSVPYTQGNWEGELGTDVVAIPGIPSLSAKVDVVCILKSNKFFVNGSNWQGIIGLAYKAVVRPDETVLPFFDALLLESEVSDVFALQLCRRDGGFMTIGGIDPKLYVGDVSYLPLRREWYYEVILTGLSVGDIPVSIDCKELNCEKAIVDSGTTNLRLPIAVFDKVVELFRGVLARGEHANDSNTIPLGFWTGESIMCWSEEAKPWQQFPNIHISLAHSWNSTITLIILPQQYLLQTHGKAKSYSIRQYCYKFAISPSSTGTVLGAVIMEGFYVIFDRQNKRIGFAKSSCGTWEPCCSQPEIVGPLPASDTMKCVYDIRELGNDHALVTLAYIMAGLSALCMVPVFIMMIQWIWSRTLRHRTDTHSDTNILVDEE